MQVLSHPRGARVGADAAPGAPRSVSRLGRGLVSALCACLVAAAGCTLHGEADALAAARADSSAAGYAVGAAPADSSRSATLATAARRGTDTARAPSSGTATASAHPAAPQVARSDTVAAAQPQRPALAASVPASPPPIPAVAPAAGTSGQVDEFLSYDARTRVVEMRLIAGYDASNGSLNFNGDANGRRGIIVPLGWRVRVATENDDADLSHSIVVIDDMSNIPVELPMPAFAGATTSEAAVGLATGESETVSFTASRAGRYLIACGVPGHGQGGQWLRLIVSPTATAPSYTQ